MSKIILSVLTFSAFLYAAWLVLLRRQLPNPKHSRGLRRRFILATLLFVGMFGAISARGNEKEPQVLCYKALINADQTITGRQIVTGFKAVWQTLDPNQSENFRNKLESAVGEGLLRKKTADMLAIAFSELAYHKRRKLATCYIGLPFSFTVREDAQQQLKLLEDARKSGKIDEETVTKIHATLSKDVETLYRAKMQGHSNDWDMPKFLAEEYKSGKIVPGDSALVAGKIIVEMEESQVPDLNPTQRLSLMKKQVESLLIGDKENRDGGPVGNDWMDPGIHPNVFAVFEKVGLIPTSPMVMCYKRASIPVKARSEELKKLQQELLDENVKAGVLDVEVAERAATATNQEPVVDYATEADIRDYQKKVRRIIRLLYKHGELPSSFVKKIEETADIEIISFDSAKALRNDVRWHLGSLFWEPVGDEVLKILEKRGLIPPACNHRRIMELIYINKPGMSDDANKPGLSNDAKRQLSEFETLLESKDELSFPEDKKVKIEDWQIPKTDTEYKLKIRRVCRALIKTGLVNQNSSKTIEDLIEIPIFGVLESR